MCNTLHGVIIACYASPALAIVGMSVYLSVCLSVTRWHSVKTMQASITKSSQTGSPRTLVFGISRKGSPRARELNESGVGKIRNFQPISRRIMTLNGRYAFCCRKDASFSANHKNLNEDRPIHYQQQEYRPMSLVSGGIRFVRLFAEVFRGGGIKRQWGCRERQFLAFSLGIFL